jgi:hypothetical protein
MAYTLFYTAHFKNEQSQDVEIFIYKKDADPPDTVENYELSEDNARCTLTDNSEGQTKFDCIITRELALSFFTDDLKTMTWESFVEAEHDTWKIKVIIDTQSYFDGFITPDEGYGPFQDKPYDVTIRATNGLALLKGTELTDVNGDPFDVDHFLIEYIAGALKKTGLDLNIRIYCGIFHLAMQNKASGLNYDMFQQTKVNYRTFQKDAVTTVSCYDALLIIFGKFCTIEYWNGMWVIASIGEKQYIPDTRYYVDYDSDGVVISGAIDPNNYARIGKDMEIYPINESQDISSRYGVKSVRTPYMYVVWPELPKNNKFERGTEFESGVATDEDDLDNDGDTSEIIGTYKKYTIDDYQYGKFSGAGNVTLPFVPGADTAYRESIYNQFGIEIERKLVLTNTTGTNNYLFGEGIPVKSQSKIRLSFDFKHTGGSVDFGNKAIIRVYLYPTGITNDALWLNGSTTRWQPTSTTVGSYIYFYDNGEDSSKWKTFTIEPDFIPQDGTLHILMENSGTGGDHEYRNFSFEYIPFVAGGYIQVKGDYWLRTQASIFPDSIDEEVFISDSPQRVFKGAMLFMDQLTDPAWYRHGPTTDANVLDESRHFKEILNLYRFNHSYRRMYALEGEFNGLNWAAENDSLVKLPIGFFWMYREVDMPAPRDFVLVPPLKMDLMRGWITANLVEVKKDSNDGTQEGTAEFKYIF